jgi:hypothetical protein
MPQRIVQYTRQYSREEKKWTNKLVVRVEQQTKKKAVKAATATKEVIVIE